MISRDVFDVALRLGGVWNIWKAVMEVYSVILKLFNLPPGSTSQTPIASNLLYMAFSAGVGVALIAYAKPIGNLVFRHEQLRYSAKTHVQQFLHRAEAAEATGGQITDGVLKQQFADLARQWRELARRAEDMPT